MTTSKPPILLLKTRSSPHDAYHDTFSTPTSNYTPKFIPVLEHKYNEENLNRVKRLLRGEEGRFVSETRGTDQETTTEKDEKEFGGMIFTSQRAVEGFARIVQEIDETNPTPLPPIPLYVVGPATHRTLQTLTSSSPLLSNTSILGSETGNGEALAHFMLSEYTTRHPNAESRPALLFLVGEVRRDIIPKTLAAGGGDSERKIDVQEWIVYETGVMEGFEEEYRKEILEWNSSTDSSSRRSVSGKEIPWTVVFSPTGTDAMMRVLSSLYTDADTDEIEGSKKKEKKHYIATIGPTTRDHLVRTFGIEPDVCAEKPSPEGIESGIRLFLESLAE